MTLIHTTVYFGKTISKDTRIFLIKSRLQTATVKDAISWQISKESGDKRLSYWTTVTSD